MWGKLVFSLHWQGILSRQGKGLDIVNLTPTCPTPMRNIFSSSSQARWCSLSTGVSSTLLQSQRSSRSTTNTRGCNLRTTSWPTHFDRSVSEDYRLPFLHPSCDALQRSPINCNNVNLHDQNTIKHSLPFAEFCRSSDTQESGSLLQK